MAVIEKAADFTLTTQDGGTLGLRELKGKVLLVGFVFTTCNGSCPATTHRMGQVQQALKDRGLLKGGAFGCCRSPSIPLAIRRKCSAAT